MSHQQRAAAIGRNLAAAGRVAAIAGVETLGRSRHAKVPVAADELDRAWLTRTLCAEHPGTRVVDYATEAVPPGTSHRFILKLAYNVDPDKTGLPTRLFAKTTRTLRQRLLMGLSETIAGETAFYTRFRPELGIEAPVGYAAAWDRRSWRSFSLLEDIAAARGATFLGPDHATTRAQMADLLANLATMHGHFWQDARLADLPTPADFVRVFSTYTNVPARLRAGSQRAHAVIPAALRGSERRLYDGLLQALTETSTRPVTLLHGDPHVGNTYLTRDKRMGYADWQIIRRGGWAFDVAYAMATSLEVADRRRWERELLDGYLDHLADAGGPRIAPAAGWDAYRRQVIYPYLAWLATIGRSALQPRMQPDEVSLGVIRRAADAVADLEPLA